MVEQWSRWEPMQNIAKKYQVVSLSDEIMNDGKFIIVLSDMQNKKKGLQVIYEKGVRAFKVTYESFRQKLFYDLHQKYGSDFYGSWTFFKVENSEYIKWLHEQSYAWSDAFRLEHLSIFATDSIIDIASNCDPKFEFIDM
jgi:hypothetical protein